MHNSLTSIQLGLELLLIGVIVFAVELVYHSFYLVSCTRKHTPHGSLTHPACHMILFPLAIS